MPSRPTSGGLPFFNTPGATARTILPRACLSPRIFLTCIMATFTLCWLLLYSTSHLSIGFGSTSPTSSTSLPFGASPLDADNEIWARLDQQQKNLRQLNSTLFSTVECEVPSGGSSVRGSDYNRASVCTVENLCVDAERGIWIHLAKGSTEFPPINLVAADPGSDAYFRPTILDHFPPLSAGYRFLEETLFLFGPDPTLQSSTWTLNNLLPLHNAMMTHGGSRSSWLMQVQSKDTFQSNSNNDYNQRKHSLDQDHQRALDTVFLIPHGREILLENNLQQPLQPHQIRAPPKNMPICFAKAVIGLQSSCTRPYCEHLIGGQHLVDSLRDRALESLRPTMARYQKTDPAIVHPPVLGEHTPKTVLNKDDRTILTGEYSPRSLIEVSLLGRFGNTSIPNASALELSLLARGISAKTIHFDRPEEISTAQAAQLFEHSSILVAPQGEGLGYAEWMKPGTVVISILPRFTRSSKVYTDRMMAFGKRLFAWDCMDQGCVQPDRELAHECIELTPGSDREGITPEEFEDFVNQREDFRQRSTVWKSIADCYTRDVSRRIHVEELTTLIEGLVVDFGPPTQAASALVRRGAEGDTTDEEDEEEGDDMDQSAGMGSFIEVGNPEDQAVHPSTQEADGGEAMEEEEMESADPDSDEQVASSITDASHDDPEDLDKEGVVRIQGPQGKDQGNRKDPTSQPPKVTPSVDTPTTPPPAVWPANTWPVPRMSFVEYCQHGRCCGSARAQQTTSTPTISLTPCASSMASFVFGAKSVWGPKDDPASSSLRESQSLVWQVNLGRTFSSHPLA